MNLPWSSHQTLVIDESGPWIAKKLTGGVFAWCPACQTYAETKFGRDETGTIKCRCHQSSAKIIEKQKVSE